jgi:hypothetical protein
VSLDPAPERVWIPSREFERVRCPRAEIVIFQNAHDETQHYYTLRCSRLRRRRIGRSSPTRGEGWQSIRRLRASTPVGHPNSLRDERSRKSGTSFGMLDASRPIRGRRQCSLPPQPLAPTRAVSIFS